MRVTVLGVGLIGGSVGMAARNHLGANVVGYDPNPGAAGEALERGALDDVAGDVAAACKDAELVVCASPVAGLGDLVAEALIATDESVAITDVGSVKGELVARHGPEPRFIGGHPLAGAETEGVGGARADLFEGARWFLTPTSDTEGVLYDRVQRFASDLGAKPQAIEADEHDRLMAAVSQLPHVIANLLVERAATSLGREGAPEVGPSFRDATRVAGSNPAIWPDIFEQNSDALADEVEALAGRLGELASMLRSGERAGIEAWHGQAAESRRGLFEAQLEGGPLEEVRVLVENRPGVLAELALALGKAGVNIEDMALHPAADMRSGAVSVFVAGQEEASRTAEIVAALGHQAVRVPR